MAPLPRPPQPMRPTLIVSLPAAWTAVGSKLVDGAWAGRFAHRYRAYKAPPVARVESVDKALVRLDDIRRSYPDIDGVAREYPDLDPAQALRMIYETRKTRRGIFSRPPGGLIFTTRRAVAECGSIPTPTPATPSRLITTR